MLPSLASVEALEARLGATLSGADLSRAQAALDDASALIRTEADREWPEDEHGDIDWGDIDAAGISTIESIALAAAARVYRNPDGATQISVGDVSSSFNREGMSGAVFLTNADRRAIRRVVGVSAVASVPLATPYMEREVDPELKSLMGAE